MSDHEIHDAFYVCNIFRKGILQAVDSLEDQIWTIRYFLFNTKRV